MSDTGAKGRSTTDEDEFSEITKTVKRVDCLWAHGARSGKKCDTGRQRQKQSGVKRCPDGDSVAKDRSGAGDNECAERSKNGKLRPLLVGPRLSFWEKVRHGEAKTEAELAAVIISEFQKLENASIACRPTAPARKKNATRGPKQEGDRSLWPCKSIPC